MRWIENKMMQNSKKDARLSKKAILLFWKVWLHIQNIPQKTQCKKAKRILKNWKKIVCEWNVFPVRVDCYKRNHITQPK